jgi:hypothetical protein
MTQDWEPTFFSILDDRLSAIFEKLGVTPPPLNVCPYPLFSPPSPSIVTQDVKRQHAVLACQIHSDSLPTVHT